MPLRTFNSLIAIKALIGRELLRSRRFFGFEVVMPALMAFLFLTIFRLALGAEGANALLNGLPLLVYVGAGFIGISTMQYCFYAGGYSLMFDKMERVIEDLLTAPLTGLEIASGYIIASLLRGLTTAITVLTMLWFYIDLVPLHWMLLLFFLLTGALSLSAISLICAILSAKWDSLAAKESFFAIPLLQLSGAFFPLSALQEGFWQTLMSLNPLYYIIDGVRYAITGVNETELGLCMIVSIVTVVLSVLIAGTMFSSGYKLKT